MPSESGAPLCIDLFCGRGGWARAFLETGYRVVGFDNADMRRWYPGEFVRAKVECLDGSRFRKATVIVASPPCTRFSTAAGLRRKPEEGMVLVREAFRIGKEAGIPFVLENVAGAVKYISAEYGEPRLRARPFYFWGNFPGFLIHRTPPFFKSRKLRPSENPDRCVIKSGPSQGRIIHHNRRDDWGSGESAKVAMIPPEIARPLAEALLA